MKIIFTSNKTYRGSIDGSWWYFYLPLKQLGHDVHFYDTVLGEEKSYTDLVESFKPDLIFSIMTGDSSIAPKEPWQEILRETNTGRTKTFNWFCDDTWRYDGFSKKACRFFNVCSTPERSMVQNYKNDGYDNIIVANWHANSELFNNQDYQNRKTDISFIGHLTKTRRAFFNQTSLPITFLSGITQKELFQAHGSTRIGVNLSTNDNDRQKKTQMKQRMFEVPAGGGVLLTQHHDGIEEYYEIDKEIITFKCADEFNKKAKFLINNSSFSNAVATNGHKRFLKNHDSVIRLMGTLDKIKNL